MMLRCLVALAFLATVTMADKKILVVGDSMGDYSGASFGDFCLGAVQINRAIGGTTALQWRNNNGDMSFADSLAAAGTMNGDDIVVVFVHQHCGEY